MLARLTRWLAGLVASKGHEVVEYWRGKALSLALLLDRLTNTLNETAVKCETLTEDNKRLQAELTQLETRHKGLTTALADEREIRQREGQRLAAVSDPTTQPPRADCDRYPRAIAAATFCDQLMPFVESMQLGIYKRGQQLLVVHTPLTEEQLAAGWRLLNVQESMHALRKAARMAMGVWN